MIRNSLILFAPMGRGIRLNDIKKLRCRLAPVARHIERVESGFRELSATTPIRSPKSVPDTVSRSREFQVHIHPRARVDTVQDRPESCSGRFSAAFHTIVGTGGKIPGGYRIRVQEGGVYERPDTRE